MARDIYESKLSKLRELKQLRKTDVLAKEIQRLARQINQRFYRLEKKGLEGDTAYRYAQRETSKSKPRYTTNINKLEDMSIQELYELGTKINAKIVSKTSTITGLSQLAERRITMGLKELFGDTTKEEKDEWIKFLENGGSELMNNRWFSSYQVAEDWREFTASGGISLDKFIAEYNQQKNKEDFDYGDLRRRLVNLKKKG